jgi:hypothetical protein
MMKKNKTLLLILAISLVAGFVLGAGVYALGTTGIDWWVMGGGGGPASGGEVSLNSTFGQPVTGSSSAGEVTLQSGYWAGLVKEIFTIALPLVIR